MHDPTRLVVDAAEAAIPIHTVTKANVAGIAESIGAHAARWVAGSRFTAKAGSHIAVPDADGAIAGVLVGAPKPDDPFAPLAIGALARALPPGTYRLAEAPADPDLAVVGWLIGAYRFDRYRRENDDREPAQLVAPAGTDRDRALAIARGVHLACDLINTPASDLGPAALAAAAEALARDHGVEATAIVGDALIEEGFPLIHTVGRAAAEPPQLVDFRWGEEAHPKVTLVGKGVTFDTGGLDLKPPAAMALMKKDMGGAASVLGLASMIMDANLPVRLRVLIPCVENSVAGASFRPGDVLTSRKGLTVEIGNTDAEGRLVLADALALADSEAPELIVDMATLTGAARVALGPDLPPFYTRDEEAAAELARHAQASADPLWRMPLWPPYDDWLKGQVGDLTNAPEKSFAGSITAALFLARFVEEAHTHIHLDIYAWSRETRAHIVRGAAAQGIRALFAYLSHRYAP